MVVASRAIGQVCVWATAHPAEGAGCEPRAVVGCPTPLHNGDKRESQLWRDPRRPDHSPTVSLPGPFGHLFGLQVVQCCAVQPHREIRESLSLRWR